MVADFMTKPLQGSIFTKFRDLIMGSLPRNEVSQILTQDSVKHNGHDGLAQKDLHHRSVLDDKKSVLGGRRTDDKEV
jgi:hypothetical protein